jgi:ParB family chromosome partitioning protein
VRATEELVALAPSAGAKERKRRTPAKRITAPAAVELADKLSDAFDTRVRVDLGRRKGRITVEFASIDDLERIVALMAPQLATRTPDSQPGAGPDGADQPVEPPAVTGRDSASQRVEPNLP